MCIARTIVDCSACNREGGRPHCRRHIDLIVVAAQVPSDWIWRVEPVFSFEQLPGFLHFLFWSGDLEVTDVNVKDDLQLGMEVALFPGVHFCEAKVGPALP